MTRLMLSLIAAVFMIAAASIAYASCGASHYSAVSIDPSGHTVVSIQAPSHETVTASHDYVTLDSNGHWTAYRFEGSAASSRMAGEHMKKTTNMYCFDASSRFCANAY